MAPVEDSLTFGNGSICLTLGDITRIRADALVNAANSALAGGGGVDGAIHRAGGPVIMAECRQIGRCETGDAVVTSAGMLEARYVIHAVAPVWRGGHHGEPALLASAYRKCMAIGNELSLHSIAFPSLGTGVYGYPVEQAAQIALRTVAAQLQQTTTVTVATFVLFSTPDYETFSRGLHNL